MGKGRHAIQPHTPYLYSRGPLYGVSWFSLKQGSPYLWVQLHLLHRLKIQDFELIAHAVMPNIDSIRTFWLVWGDEHLTTRFLGSNPAWLCFLFEIVRSSKTMLLPGVGCIQNDIIQRAPAVRHTVYRVAVGDTPYMYGVTRPYMDACSTQTKPLNTSLKTNSQYQLIFCFQCYVNQIQSLAIPSLLTFGAILYLWCYIGSFMSCMDSRFKN